MTLWILSVRSCDFMDMSVRSCDFMGTECEVM